MGHVGLTSEEKEKINKMMKFKTNGMMEDDRERGNVGGEIFLFLLFMFFSDLRKSVRQNSSG